MQVYLAKNRTSGELVAVKVVPLNVMDTSSTGSLSSMTHANASPNASSSNPDPISREKAIIKFSIQVRTFAGGI